VLTAKLLFLELHLMLALIQQFHKNALALELNLIHQSQPPPDLLE
jgi:hypothetical protein